MPDLAGLPGWSLYLGLALLALVILWAGAKLAGTADKLADATGWGEATVGAVLLGGATSLPGIVASVTAAATGHPTLAISNAIGGIAVQTLFLVVADMFHPRVNLEHAAASTTNLFQAALLVTLLSVPLVAATLPPELAIGWISPFSFVLLLGYVAGVRAAGQIRLSPMWQPERTEETKDDTPEPPPRESSGSLLRRFALLGAITGLAGYALTALAVEISQRTGLGETAVGGLITAVITSLPELVTSIAAVRRGALNLAVGGIIGGNAFDVLFLAFADVAYTDGSLYERFEPTHQLVVATSILMTAVLLMGLVTRQRQGARIGFEGWLVILLYAGLATAMARAG